jgi:hypothetical protein
MSMRCEVNRRPRIGTVRNESAAEATARYRHVAALSLLHRDSSQLRAMSGTGFYGNGAVARAGFVSEASRRGRFGRRASGFDIGTPSWSERVARSRALAGHMAESNPAATGLAASTSMRCEVNRRPGIGTVRSRDSAAEGSAR